MTERLLVVSRDGQRTECPERLWRGHLPAVSPPEQLAELEEAAGSAMLALAGKRVSLLGRVEEKIQLVVRAVGVEFFAALAANAE